MCEIAIVDPAEAEAGVIASEAMDIYETQRSSLGLVAVYAGDDGLEYNTYKAVVPDEESVWEFVTENAEAGWLIIHGRMATAGGVSEESAHPIEIDCDCCDVDYVLHNGVIGRHEQHIELLEGEGHDFTTQVDTEIIAHEWGSVPDLRDEDLSDYEVFRQPAYILLNDDTMFIYSSNKYHMDEDGYMATKWRSQVGPAASDDNYQAITISA